MRCAAPRPPRPAGAALDGLTCVEKKRGGIGVKHGERWGKRERGKQRMKRGSIESVGGLLFLLMPPRPPLSNPGVCVLPLELVLQRAARPIQWWDGPNVSSRIDPQSRRVPSRPPSPRPAPHPPISNRPNSQNHTIRQDPPCPGPHSHPRGGAGARSLLRRRRPGSG